MNPDIQRIAEKWMTELVTHGLLHQGDIKRAIDNALTELSALRDTQERELRGDIVDLETKIKCRTNLWDKANKEIKSLRAELARRDEVEKELREVVDSWDGSGAGSAYGVAGKVKRILRSRIGELEAKLEDARNQWLERDT